MAGFNFKLLIPLAFVLFSGVLVAGEVHHVVGGERGWLPTSDIPSWASGRVFRVGDKIWFGYPVTQAQDNVVELQSHEEFEACDLRNPIKMYTDREDGVTLDKEGIRYFTSANPEDCKNGLKLPVHVQPTEDDGDSKALPPKPYFPTPVEPKPKPEPKPLPAPTEPKPIPPPVEPKPLPPPAQPKPVHPPPPPPKPSAATALNGPSVLFLVGLLACVLGL